MKERPILFSGPMVRAILEGRKTQTRRIVKPQPIDNTDVDGNFYAGDYKAYVKVDGHPNWRHQFAWEVNKYGKPGDRLWVRETFCERAGDIIYRADGDFDQPSDCTAFEETDKWKPSLFMPRWACRIVLEVVSVRVERLQDISEADAEREGIEDAALLPLTHFKDYSNNGETRSAQYSFETLWESINGPGSWDANPWVWVVEFAPYTATARAQAREGEGRKSRSAEREELQAVDRPATSAGHAQTPKEELPETK